MKLQSVVKENPEITGFQRDDKKITITLKLKNFEFIKPFQKVTYYSHDKTSIHKPRLPKTSRLPGNYLGRLTLPQKPHSNHIDQNRNFNFTIINYKNRQNSICQKGKKIIQNSCNFIRSDIGTNSQSAKEQIKNKKHHEEKVNRFFSLDIPKKQSIQLYKELKKKESVLEAQNKQKRNKKKNQMNNFDFENLYQKNKSEIGSFQKNKLSYQSPRGRFKVQIVQKINRNTENSNSKTRTIYDQFNLKYIIDKRKSFNLKNQHRFAGSNNPYFQSFISQQEINPTNIDQNDKPTAFIKTQRNSRQIQNQSLEFTQNYQQISNTSHKIQRNLGFIERENESLDKSDSNQKMGEKSADQYCENYQELIEKMNDKFLSVKKF